MRRMVKGKEHIILREDGYGGYESIEVEKLTMHMEDLFTEENLKEIEADMPAGFRKMTLIAVIKSDIANKDRLGWKQHEKVLKENGLI